MPEKSSRVNAATAAAQGPAVVLVYATFPAPAVAEAIGSALVEAGLAACVNVIPGMRAIYRWQGVLQHDDETVVIVKTTNTMVDRVVGFVRVAHPYTNPALVALPAIGGSLDFLAWVRGETIGAR